MKISFDEWRRVVNVNLNGVFHVIQAVLPDMIEAGWGRIVNISSSSTHSGTPYMTHYVSAKSGVNGLTKSFALEFGPNGITVNAIPPGFIDTPMLRSAEQRGNLGDIEKTIAATRCGASAKPRTSRRRARSWSPRRLATSPVRSSASAGAATPNAHPTICSAALRRFASGSAASAEQMRRFVSRSRARSRPCSRRTPDASGQPLVELERVPGLAASADLNPGRWSAGCATRPRSPGLGSNARDRRGAVGHRPGRLHRVGLESPPDRGRPR